LWLDSQAEPRPLFFASGFFLARAGPKPCSGMRGRKYSSHRSDMEGLGWCTWRKGPTGQEVGREPEPRCARLECRMVQNLGWWPAASGRAGLRVGIWRQPGGRSSRGRAHGARSPSSTRNLRATAIHCHMTRPPRASVSPGEVRLPDE
jgi:hypothetical protein